MDSLKTSTLLWILIFLFFVIPLWFYLVVRLISAAWWKSWFESVGRLVVKKEEEGKDEGNA